MTNTPDASPSPSSPGTLRNNLIAFFLAHRNHSRRSIAWIISCLIWGSIALLSFQTWSDYRAQEQNAYKHLSDTSRQIERGIVDLFATNRSISNAIHEAVRRNQHSRSSCPLVCQDELKSIRRLYNELTPGIELLLLDVTGKAVAETDPDLVNRLVGLPEIIDQFKARGGIQADVRFARTLSHAPAFMISRAIRSPAGDLQAIAILLEPLSVLDAVFDVPLLGEGRNVTLLDAKNTLLVRKPTPLTVNIGQQLEPMDYSHAGPGAGSFWIRSPIDRVQRLTIKRSLPYALTSGELILLVGLSPADYLGGWVFSSIVNGGLILLLITAWLWGLNTMRTAIEIQERLEINAHVTRKVLMELPIPIVIVNRNTHVIVRSNTAMIECFGALAGEEQPLDRLFKDIDIFEDWSRAATPITLVELMTRAGKIHAEVHCTNVAELDAYAEPCLLLVIVDVSDRVEREHHLKTEAFTDPLTGLANRRKFSLESKNLIAEAHHQGHDFSIISIDLDHFKHVNDEYGHDVGDQVLIATAKTIQLMSRDQDIPARMGGEEFSVLLPQSGLEEARMLAERIRHTMATTPIPLANGKILHVTASLGIATWQEGEQDIQNALKRADEALYRAKECGRNRVMD